MKSLSLQLSEFYLVENQTTEVDKPAVSLLPVHFYFRHVKIAFSQCLLCDTHEANQFMKRR